MRSAGWECGRDTLRRVGNKTTFDTSSAVRELLPRAMSSDAASTLMSNVASEMSLPESVGGSALGRKGRLRLRWRAQRQSCRRTCSSRPTARILARVMCLLGLGSWLPAAGEQQAVCGNRPEVYVPGGGLVCSIQATNSVLDAPWRGRGGGGSATGVSHFAAPEKRPRMVWSKNLWSQQIGTKMSKLNSPVIAGDGSIFFVNAIGQVFAYAPDGTLLWIVSLNAAVEGVGAVWGNVLFVSSKNGLHAIDTRPRVPTDKRLMFTWTLPNMPTGIEPFQMSSSPVVDGDDQISDNNRGPALYLTAHDLFVYKLRIRGTCNGLVSVPCTPLSVDVIWRKKLDFTTTSQKYHRLKDDRCEAPFNLASTARLDCIMCRKQLPCSAKCEYCEDQTIGGYNPLKSSPVLQDDVLYVVTWDGLHALRRSNGDRVWHHFFMLNSETEFQERYTVGTSFHRQRLMLLSPVALSDRVLFPSGGNVLCVNRDDGSLRWRFQHPRGYDFISSPVVYRPQGSVTEADAILVSAMDGAVHALHVDTGALLWTYATGIENSTQGLSPIVDSYSNIYFLTKEGITALSGMGSPLWNEPGCAGDGISSGAAISREGMLIVTCNDTSLRQYCCRTCEVSLPEPSTGSPFKPNSLSIKVALRHRMLWTVGGSPGPTGYCRIGDAWLPIRRINDTLIECQIPSLQAQIDDAARASIVLPQHTVLYGKCFADLTSGPVEVPCSYVDESDAFLPVCKRRIQDPAIGFSTGNATARFYPGGIACTKVVRVNVALDIAWIGNETCAGHHFTYFFPIIVVANTTVFPAKIPKDYTQLIINVVIVALVFIGALIVYFWVRLKLQQHLEELENQKVDEMAAYLNSPDLDPRTKQVIMIARNRLHNTGTNLIESWDKWRQEMEDAHNSKIFMQVGNIRNQEQYDALLKKHDDIHDPDKLWMFVWSQLNKGESVWVQTRRILDILSSFSPGWGDLWACYLEVEIEGFRKKLRSVRQLRSFARRGHTVWTRNHEYLESVRQHGWSEYHKHSLSVDRGFSSVCRALTKTTIKPTTSVGLAGPLGEKDEELTFVYFGDGSSNAVGIGVANESIPLNVKPHETGREQQAWYYASGASQDPYSNVVGEVRITVVSARMSASRGRWGYLGALRNLLGQRPYVQVSTNPLDQNLPREWKTSTYRGVLAGSPSWNEEFRICLRGNESSIRIEVMNDTLPRATLLGSARLPLDLLRHASCRCWVPVFSGEYIVGQVLLETAFSVAIEEVNVVRQEMEARTIFRSFNAESGGLIDSEMLTNQLTLLGYPQARVDELVYIGDRRCTGKIGYMQYWNALLPFLFENSVRYRASTIQPIFRSEDSLPEIEPLTPPESPQSVRPNSGDGVFSRAPSGFSRVPSAASVVSAISAASGLLIRALSRSGSGGESRALQETDGDAGIGVNGSDGNGHREIESHSGNGVRAEHAQSSSFERAPSPVGAFERMASFGRAVSGASQTIEMGGGIEELMALKDQEEVAGKRMDLDAELMELADKMMHRSMLFYCLDIQIVRALLRFSEQRTLQAEEHLYSEEDSIDCISVVRSGLLTLYRPAQEAGFGDAALTVSFQEQEIEPEREEFGHLLKGDVIGESQCLHKQKCSVFFKARTKTRLFQIQRKHIMQMLPRCCREHFDPKMIIESPLASPMACRGHSSGRMRQSAREPAALASTMAHKGPSPPRHDVSGAGDSSIPPRPVKRFQVHKAGGAMYEGGRCVAKNLPIIKSGDRVRVHVDRGNGVLRFWLNKEELMHTIAGFSGVIRPMVYVTGKGSSVTIVERKERVIRLVVVAGEGLPSADFLTGLSDPYVKIHLTSVQAQNSEGPRPLPIVHSFRTETIRNTLTPEWNESFILTPYNLEDQLLLECWDWDLVGDDDILGSIQCQIGDVIDHCDGLDRWYPLHDHNGHESGKLCLRFEVSEPDEKYLPTQIQKASVSNNQTGPMFRQMSYQAAARMRRPRLKDLPECILPDPALIRSIFQRCFSSKLTVPQIRYFLQLWENFEIEVLGESIAQQRDRFKEVREMVWAALLKVDARRPSGHIGLPEVRRRRNEKGVFVADKDRTSRIWFAIDAGQASDNPQHREKTAADEKKHRMEVFRGKFSEGFIVSGARDDASALVQHQRHRGGVMTGTSLFLAPGALSGLMRPLSRQNAQGPGGSRKVQTMLKAQWKREQHRPSSAAKLHARRQKTGRGKSARFAPDDGSLTHTFIYPGVDEGAEVAIRQTPILDSKTFDDPDAGLALQVGWGQAGDSKGHRQNAQRAFWNAQRAENFMTSENVTALPVRIGTGAGGASERMEIKSGAGRLKSGSQGPKRPDSAISKRDKAILKRTASMMRSFRYDKWRLGVERKRSLAERSLSSVDSLHQPSQSSLQEVSHEELDQVLAENLVDGGTERLVSGHGSGPQREASCARVASQAESSNGTRPESLDLQSRLLTGDAEVLRIDHA